MHNDKIRIEAPYNGLAMTDDELKDPYILSQIANSLAIINQNKLLRQTLEQKDPNDHYIRRVVAKYKEFVKTFSKFNLQKEEFFKSSELTSLMGKILPLTNKDNVKKLVEQLKPEKPPVYLLPSIINFKWLLISDSQNITFTSIDNLCLAFMSTDLGCFLADMIF